MNKVFNIFKKKTEHKEQQNEDQNEDQNAIEVKGIAKIRIVWNRIYTAWDKYTDKCIDFICCC